nr:hypothetical protein REQ54_01072 [Rhizobium sp. Q54]
MMRLHEECHRPLLVKQARLARVLELWHVEQLSTQAIAERLALSEVEVCRLIEEGEKPVAGEWQ